jgi:uncharacterized protein YfaS (alpha-2-macroglobulin family)
VPEGAIPGSVKAYVKIYPSSFSQLVEGLDNIFRMPYGCFEQTSSTTYPNVLALDYLKRNKLNVPKVEVKARQFIHLGYQRLLSFEVAGGGFDWFGRAPANVKLTAYGLMEFDDMAKVHDVDPRLLERTRAWLLSKRNADGSWSSEQGMLHEDAARAEAGLARLATTAYVAWAVFADGKAGNYSRVTLDYLLARPPAEIKDPHVLALVCNALLAIDPKGKEAGPYLAQLAQMAEREEGGKRAFWKQPAGARTTFYGAGQSGQVETTALAVLALLKAGREPGLARAALGWIVSRKDPNGTWHSTQATVLALKALLAGTGKALGQGTRTIKVRLGDSFAKELVIPADQAEVMKQVDLSPHLGAGRHTLTLRETSSTGAGYQVTFRYHVPEKKEEGKKGPLTIAVRYDRTRLKVDETVGVEVEATNAMPAAAPMVMLDLPIPPGFAIEADDFAKMVRDGTIARYQVMPRGVLVYLLNLEPGKPLVLRYRLRATMPVKVRAPGARVYEYYDPQKQGRSPAAAFEVKGD